MADSLRIKTIAPDGRPVRCVVAYTLDQDGYPAWSERRTTADGHLVIRRPVSERFGLSVLWEVPGFGQVMVNADNEESGYRVGGPAIDFRQEAARTKLRAVRRMRAAREASGTTLSTATCQRVDRAAAIVRDMNRFSPDEQRAKLDVALCDLMWAGEEIELAYAKRQLTAMDKDRRNALLFGSPYFTTRVSDRFKEHFAALFNFATTPFYRARLEPEEDKPRWEPIDKVLSWLDSQSIRAKGHPLVWFHKAGVPDWMRSLSFATLKQTIYEQVVTTVSRYKDRIKIWDVINEAHDPVAANELDYTQEQRLELTAVAARAVRDADPGAIRIVNCNRHWGYYRGEWEMRMPLHPVEYLEALDALQVDYDVIGLQMYHGGDGHWVRDMADQSALMEVYASFGRPIHITEVQTPSSIEPERAGPRERFFPEKAGWWHHRWDPETQADWVEQFYTIALSKPLVQAVTWWSLSDRSTFWPHGGLLDKDDNPKPAYHRLKELIESVGG